MFKKWPADLQLKVFLPSDHRAAQTRWSVSLSSHCCSRSVSISSCLSRFSLLLLSLLCWVFSCFRFFQLLLIFVHSFHSFTLSFRRWNSSTDHFTSRFTQMLLIVIVKSDGKCHFLNFYFSNLFPLICNMTNQSLWLLLGNTYLSHCHISG